MSQENVDLVRSISAAHERGDYGSADWGHPDIEYVIVGGLTPGSWKGRAATASAARELFSVWEEHRSVVEELRPLDDERVLVLAHSSGRGKTSGVEPNATQWQSPRFTKSATARSSGTSSTSTVRTPSPSWG